MNRAEAFDEYERALRAGQREYKERISAGLEPYPKVLDQLLPDLSGETTQRVGLLEIPAERIVGTCTGGRICFGEADVEEVEWSMREGRIKISCTIVYSKEDGEEFYINYWVDPYATRHSHTATLVRGSDGLWRKN